MKKILRRLFLFAVTMALAAGVLPGGVIQPAYAVSGSVASLPHMNRYGYDADTWISTAEYRALACAAAYADMPSSFQSSAKSPTKVLIAKDTGNDGSGILYMDFYSQTNYIHEITVYPKGYSAQPTPGANTNTYVSTPMASLVTPCYTVSASEFSAAQEAVSNTGTCGDNAVWTLSGDTLTISGTGDMEDYQYSSRVPWKDKTFAKVVVESGITSIGNRAFDSDTSGKEKMITSVSLPNTVKRIGERSFYGCKGLAEITIPGSVTEICINAFCSCENIETITFSEGLERIYDYGFGYIKNKLTSITLPKSLKRIDTKAFGYCEKLSKVLMSKDTMVEADAFKGCANDLHISHYGEPDNPSEPPAGSVPIAATFPDAAFQNWLSQNADKDGDGYLSPDEIKAVTEIKCASQGISSLAGIEQFTALENLDCSGNQLKTLDVSKLTALKYLNASSNQLEALDVSANKKLISLDVSDNKLTALNLSHSVLRRLSTMGNLIKSINISGCPFIATMVSDTARQITPNGQGVYYYKKTSDTYVYCYFNLSLFTEIVTGSGVIAAEDPSSYPGGNDEPGQDEPDEITVKDLKYKLNHDKKTATVIGPVNKNIKKITIPDTVKNQKGVKYKVTGIADKAFKGCKKATETTIGKNVQSIGKDAYNGCKSLKKITIKTKNLTLKSVGKNAFKKISKKVTVKCPKGMKESYKKILAKKGMPKTATYK